MKIKVYLPAMSNGQACEPHFASVTVTSKMLERIEGISNLCHQERLAAITTFDSVDTWCDAAFAAHHRIIRDELVVGPDLLWFRALASSSDCDVRTADLNVSAFLDLCRDNADATELFIGADARESECLRELVLDQTTHLQRVTP